MYVKIPLFGQSKQANFISAGLCNMTRSNEHEDFAACEFRLFARVKYGDLLSLFREVSKQITYQYDQGKLLHTFMFEMAV